MRLKYEPSSEPLHRWVDIYAKDEKRFNADFAKYFSALLELGTKNLA